MHNEITPDQLHNMPIGKIAELPASQLAQLTSEVGQILQKAKFLKDWLDGAIFLKYEKTLATFRQRSNKPSGTVHLIDEGFKITSNLPKRIEWKQSQLKKIVSNIQNSGDDPEEYVNISYKVFEAKYNVWPDHIKKTFESARVFKLGKQSFTIQIDKGVDHE